MQWVLNLKYDLFTLFSINDNKFFKLTLFLLIIRAEATLIYKAVIVRNFKKKNSPNDNKKHWNNVSKSSTVLVFTSCEII